MRTFRIRLTLLFAAVPASLLAAPNPAIKVGPNVHVSKAHADWQHGEIELAADPTDPKVLLGCSVVSLSKENVARTVAYASFDGGKTWESKVVAAHGSMTADPTCGFGPDGHAYFGTLGYEMDGPNPIDLALYRSNDRGRTWQPPFVLSSGVDRPFLTVDQTKSKYRGRVYVNATDFFKTIDEDPDVSGVSLFRSTDDGGSLVPRVTRVSSGGHWVLPMGNGAVLSDGTFVFCFGEFNKLAMDEPGEPIPSKPNASLKLVTSDDGGEHLSKATVITSVYFPGWRDTVTSIIPRLAVDSSEGPFKDRLYLVWPDVRSGRSEILLVTSADKGKTWSKPIVVNDDRANAKPQTGPDHSMPLVAVNSSGVVGVSWYDRRENADNLGWWQRFAASYDGGESFAPSVRVSTAPFTHDRNERVVPFAMSTGGGLRRPSSRGGSIKAQVDLNFYYFDGGDTGGLAATADGAFHTLWVDNRTGIPQVWTAAVEAPGKAVRNGSPELAELADLSESASLHLENVNFEPAKGTVSMDGILVNTSKEAISGPLKVRVTLLKSTFGVPEIVGADNGEKGPGAVWDFTPLLSGSVLPAGESSKPKRLEFRLSDLRPFRPSRAGRSLVDLEAKVLAKAPPKKEEKSVQTTVSTSARENRP